MNTGNTENYLKTSKEVLFPTYNPYPIVPEKAKGSVITDINGTEYIDFTGGIAVVALGHCHPEIVKVLQEQSDKLWHLSNYFINPNQVRLAEELTSRTFADRVFFANSGTEANEAALKMARKFASVKYGNQKNKIVSCLNSFHGRSLFTVSVGGKSDYTAGFGPLPGGLLHIPFNDLAELEKSVDENTCAILLEPLQGEGGVTPANPEFLQKCREMCDKFNALLIFDEVQCGFGRTGNLYAYMHYGVEPDVLTTAKALGCGYPISAVLTREHIAQVMQPGTHGSTFGGNPLACAIGLKALELTDRPEVHKNTLRISKQIFEFIISIGSQYPEIIGEPRGLGLLIGIPLKGKAKGKAGEICKIALKNKLLLIQAGPDVVRLAPSLVINSEELTTGLEHFAKTMKEFAGEIG